MEANAFDFHYLYISDKSVKKLMKAGIKREDIRGKQEWKTGMKYPKKYYETSVYGTLEFLESECKKFSDMGILCVIRYHCAD